MLALQYFLKRIGVSIIVFFGVSIVIFCLARLIPGDPARIALGPFATTEMVEQLRETLHLNKSLFIESNPSPVKYAASLLELSPDEVRLPLVKITNPTKSAVKKALEYANLI